MKAMTIMEQLPTQLGQAFDCCPLAFTDDAGPLGHIGSCNCDPLERARTGLVRSILEPGFVADPQSVCMLVKGATLATSRGDVDLALGFLHAAAQRFWWADPGREARGRVVAATSRLANPPVDLRTLSILAVVDPIAYAATLLETASSATPDTHDPLTTYQVGSALQASGALEPALAFLGAAVTGLRHRRARWLLAQALAQAAWTATVMGDWTWAADSAREAVALAQQTHQPLWAASARTAMAMHAAVHGQRDLSRCLLRAAEAVALPMGASAVLCDIQAIRALVALGDCQYDEAFDHLGRIFDPHDPVHHPTRSGWHVGELAEAAVHTGNCAQARRVVATLEQRAGLHPSPRLQMGLLYARPLLADDTAAEALFQEALRAATSRWPLYRARLMLGYGAWLRRHRKIVGARMPLRAALNTFAAFGASPWEERAQQELRAVREARGPQAGAWDRLTEQERQVARLAANGLTNREIGQRLYVSHRTISAHLYRIYPKLEIASRAQLRDALAVAK